MKAVGTLFVRVVPQDRGDDYMVLVGYDKPVVQRSAISYSTLNAPTRAGFDTVINTIRNNYRVDDIRDTTASNIVRKLLKAFGEDVKGNLINQTV